MEEKLERAFMQAKDLVAREGPKLREQLRPHLESLTAAAKRTISEALRPKEPPPK